MPAKENAIWTYMRWPIWLGLLICLSSCGDLGQDEAQESAGVNGEVASSQQNGSQRSDGAVGKEYVKVDSGGANVYLRPSKDSEVVTKSRRATIFELLGKEGDWYEVTMFSGEARYIQAANAHSVSEVGTLPPSSAVRKNACLELARAEDRATEEALEEYPSEIDKQIDLERLLQDQYSTVVFAKYQIPPALASELRMQCVDNDWLP